jgi:hypothetical protein
VLELDAIEKCLRTHVALGSLKPVGMVVSEEDRFADSDLHEGPDGRVPADREPLDQGEEIHQRCAILDGVREERDDQVRLNDISPQVVEPDGFTTGRIDVPVVDVRVDCIPNAGQLAQQLDGGLLVEGDASSLAGNPDGQR